MTWAIRNGRQRFLINTANSQAHIQPPITQMNTLNMEILSLTLFGAQKGKKFSTTISSEVSFCNEKCNTQLG